MKILLLALSVVAGFAAVPLDDTRSPNLTGLVGIPGGIPNRTIIVTNYTTSTADDINYDVNHSDSTWTNKVIKWGAGTFTYDKAFDFGGFGGTKGSFITLRGEGPGVTILKFTNSAYIGGLINFRSATRLTGAQSDTNFVRAWDAGYSQGSSNITIRTDGTTGYGSTYDLKVGMMICLDQLNDSNIGLNHLGYDGSFADASPQMFRGNLDRGQQQYCEIKAISSGTNLTIWPPVMLTNIQGSLSPQIWWWGDSIEGVGIENMTIDCTDSTDVGGSAAHDWAIFFHGVKSGWIKNVEVKGARKGLFGTWTSLYIHAQHCYTRLPYEDPTLTGASQYGCNPTFSSFGLIEDCIWNGVGVPILPDAGSTFWGCAYNYLTNCPYLTGDFMSSGIQSHYFGAMGWTFEGNYAPAINLDFIHGSSGHYDTLFRNRLLGTDEHDAGKINNTYAVFIMGTNRYVNVVGNVLGTTSYHVNRTWYVNAADPGNNNKSVIRAGHYGNNQLSGEGDTATVTTLWDDGNYDYVSSSTVWDASDASHTLPTSRVYGSQPSWWTTYATSPWPPVGSDLTPMYSKIPAHLVFEAGFGGATGGGTTGGGVIATGKKIHGRKR